MKMKRSVYHQLLEWKNSPTRKPLVLQGARRVGKTYILKEFGRKEFENIVYVNCYNNPAVATLFSLDKDVRRILMGLSALSGKEIKERKTLVFIDEMQELPDVVASLKYFAEKAPDIFIATATSSFEITNREETPFPTGEVNTINMYPMTFNEFVEAIGDKKMLEQLNTPGHEPLVSTLIPKYVELLRQYYFVGGMPEAVAEFISSRTPEYVRKVQLDILASYDAYIARHAGKETQRARLIFQSIPTQLAKKTKSLFLEH